ncbi:MAG: hypothetical protein V4760_06870, partial [Bdellovibrionota bacterium]
MKRWALGLAAAVLFASYGAEAVTSTSPFKDMDKVTEDLAQEFYRAWRLRISELPANYQQIATPEGVQYRAPNKTGCTLQNASSLFQPVTEIFVSSKIVKPGELHEKITYRGCNGSTLLIEMLQVKGTNPKSTIVDDVLNGKRRFVHAADETERRSIFLDPVIGPIIDVTSVATGPMASTTRFTVMQKPIVTIRSNEANGVKQSRIELQNFDVGLSKFGEGFRQRTSGLEPRYTIFQQGDLLRFRVNDEVEFTNQRRFEELYSEMIVWAINVTATEILDLYLVQLPKTEVAKPSAGANQRILDELTQALNRVTTKTELERVRLLIQDYIVNIQNGQLMAMVNGQLMAMVNGQLMAMVNGQLMAMVNGQLMAMVNNEVVFVEDVSMVNGQLMAMVNGQLMAMVN